jgi:hypothetical protein
MAPSTISHSKNFKRSCSYMHSTFRSTIPRAARVLIECSLGSRKEIKSIWDNMKSATKRPEKKLSRTHSSKLDQESYLNRCLSSKDVSEEVFSSKTMNSPRSEK